MGASLTAADIATLVEGALLGDGTALLSKVAPLDRAGPSDLAFLSKGRYLAAFHSSRAGAVLIAPEHAEERPGPNTRIVVKDPHRAMLRVVQRLYGAPARATGISSSAIIGKGAVLGEAPFIGPGVVLDDGAILGDRVTLMAGAVIGAGARLGHDVTVHEHVVLYPGTVVGSRVILHAGVRLGVDGFGYVPSEAGHEKIPHVGGCIIGDDVEIGANSTVDRGSVDDTVIGDGTKIDNLVHVGHNCRVGKRCLIMALVGLAGSAVLEDDVILAGQSGVAGHLTVGKGVRVGAQSGVIGDVAGGMTVSGFPARPHQDFLRSTSAMYRLARIVDELEELVEHGKRPVA